MVDEDDSGALEPDATDEVAELPSVSSDPQELVESALPTSILKKFRVASYRKAAAILKFGMPAEFGEVIEALAALLGSAFIVLNPHLEIGTKTELLLPVNNV